MSEDAQLSGDNYSYASPCHDLASKLFRLQQLQSCVGGSNQVLTELILGGSKKNSFLVLGWRWDIET